MGMLARLLMAEPAVSRWFVGKFLFPIPVPATRGLLWCGLARRHADGAVQTDDLAVKHRVFDDVQN